MNTNSLSDRKQKILTNSLEVSRESARWDKKNRYSRNEHIRYLKFLIPEGKKILELGCRSGDLLASFKPGYGVGIDSNPELINIAATKYPSLHFIEGDFEKSEVISGLDGPFDIIVLSDVIGELDDIQMTLAQVKQHCSEETRIIITYYNTLWEPLLRMGEWLHLKKPQVEQNWLSTADIRNIIELAGFEVIKQDWRQIIPFNLLYIGHLVNQYFATLPIIRKVCLRNYAVARCLKPHAERDPSTTVLIPCRNERGNIENALLRIPPFCRDMEIIYVEGHSRDGTFDEINRVIAKYPDRDIKALIQPGIGKADAVRAGFDIARGDILMILDADLTMPPEDLPKYYNVLVSGQGEFVNGSRLVYPMETDAMRFLNHIANHVFSMLFTYLLNQRYTDTLCGTKALYRKHYQMIVTNRVYFGDFDPFGDFDLIFGATKLNLKMIEVPIRYASRRYGTTQISRVTHGLLLVKMVIFAFRKLKAFK